MDAEGYGRTGALKVKTGGLEARPPVVVGSGGSLGPWTPASGARRVAARGMTVRRAGRTWRITLSSTMSQSLPSEIVSAPASVGATPLFRVGESLSAPRVPPGNAPTPTETFR
jgi:hypothetical protein